MLIVAASIVVIGLIFAGLTTWTGRTTGWGFLGITVGAILAATAVPNFARITGINVQAGATSSIDMKLQEVKENVTEARQIKEQVETLAKRVAQGEQNVVAMRDNVRQAYRSLFQSLAYVVLTRNLFPPPENIMKEMERHINLLAEFAYPDPQERTATIREITESAQAAQPQIPQPK